MAVAIVRGGFEYQGQKCSAASRMYVPQSLWDEMRDRMIAMMKEIKVGDVRDFRNFMGAVIDKKAFDKISGYLDDAKKNAKVIQGGGARATRATSSSRRWSKRATRRTGCCARRSSDRCVTAYVYDDAKWAETLRHRRPDVAVRADRRGVRARSRGGARGARRRCATPPATSTSTTSRPARSSGSSRSAARAHRARTTRPGSKLNLVRWVSARTVKETFAPPTDFKYPFMSEE